MAAVAVVIAALAAASYRLWWPHLVARDPDPSTRYETYRVGWKARDGAPELALALDPADLSSWQEVDRSIFSGRPHDTAHLQVVAAAPNTGRLASHAGACPPEKLQQDECDFAVAYMTLSRDPGPLPSGQYVDEVSKPVELKVRERDGAWLLLGPDYAERGLERWLPGFFGLATTQLRRYEVELQRRHVLKVGDNLHCLLVLSYKGRPLKIDTRRRCADRRSQLALQAAFDLLERAALDARRPPDGARRLARLRTAVDNCGRAAGSVREALRTAFPQGKGREQAEYLCDYAIRLGHGLLKPMPAEASGLMLQAMAWRVHGPPIMRLFYDDILQALAAAGKSESRDAVLAFTLRVFIGGSTDQRERQESDRALDALLSLAPSLPADDPLLDDAERAIAQYSTTPAMEEKHFAYARMWHEKAQAADPGSDAATKAHSRFCRAALEVAQRDADLLKSCADRLMAQWEARIASGASFDLYYNEAELAMLTARCIYDYGRTARDFAGGILALQRVAGIAAQRFPKTSEYRALHAGLEEMERFLAALSGR